MPDEPSAAGAGQPPAGRTAVGAPAVEPEHISFELGGLPPSPNETRTQHWSKRAKVDKQWRGDSKQAAVDARNRSGYAFPWPRIGIAITFYVRDRRRRDTGNLMASTGIKATIDGLVDAGLVVDDDAGHVVQLGPFDAEYRPGRQPGFRVTVTRLA